MSRPQVHTVAFAHQAWADLTSELDSDLETAWVLLAHSVGVPGAGDVTLLVHQVVPVPDAAYADRRRDGLSIRTSGWLPTLARADAEQSVPIFVHTHPGGDPRHSSWDYEVDEELARVASVRTDQGHYASLVLGGTPGEPTFQGRFKTESHNWVAVDRVRVVGERLTLLLPQDGEEESLEVFDRQVRAFGEAGQRVLRHLRVGVVGAGGTGSAAMEQLVRLGVGEIVVADPETLTDTNVTRVYGSTLKDVDRPKVDIATDAAEVVGLGTHMVPIEGEVLEKRVVESLLHCDVILGCTDDDEGRVILTRMPQALLQLLIDCGVVVDSRGGQLFDIFGRVSVVTPTSACLVCMDEIDLERARAQATPVEERERLVREGYAPELDTTDPAVVTFTTITSGFAVNELLSRLFGYCDDEPANRMLLRIGSRSISKQRREIRGNHRCGRAQFLAIGSRAPLLDYGWRDA